MTTERCDCECHAHEDDEQVCACCERAGRWTETCAWKAGHVGGHGACTPRVCAEEGESS